jgi:GT2 family glycosyltransferase
LGAVTTVTALLVSHDGARWLPAVLDGLTGQTRPADRVVAVDTGSTDDSPRILEDRLGPDVVRTAAADTSYGDAVATALGDLPALDDEWVWLLHDDSAPTPEALAALLAAAADHPTADILGPKLREWPSLRRLLEMGVTISGTGGRETGLERGEYDQGQHDRLRDVLAVNTAGMLVRRSVLEEIGFDRALPLFGNDIDFGWRAARAGHRTIVVPDAVLFHVEAAHRGARRTPVTGRQPRRGERQAALYTLLVNSALWALPWQLVRLLVGSLVRVLGFLLVRAPHEAGDELVALLRVYGRPDRILRGRLRRRRTARRRPREVRHLLAPTWVPYRHGLDFVTEVGSAVAHQAADMSAARKARQAADRTETGPVPDEAENLPADTGWLARTFTSPVAWLFAVLVLASTWSARDLLGGGMLSGGALLPAPETALDWWRTYLASGHDLAVGSTAPAAPYLLPLAVVGTVLLGKAWLVIDLLFLFCVPLAGFGGYVLLRRLTGSTGASLWGAAAYGLLPVLIGAVQQGRLGTVAAALVLPWLAHAASFLGTRHSQDRRWRAAWRSALWLAVLTAFVPLALVLAAALTVVAVAAGFATDSRRWRQPRVLAPALTPVLASVVLLLPWSVLFWDHQGITALLFEAGLPAPDLTGPLTWLDVLSGPSGDGAPWWLWLGVLLAAAAALTRSDTRARVLVTWTVLVSALALTVVLAGDSYVPPGGAVAQPLWLGFPILVAQGAAVCAAAVAAGGIRARIAGASFGWLQPVSVLVVALAVVSPLLGLGWWLVAGSDEPLARRAPTGVPTYMVEAAEADPRAGVLVIRGSRAEGFEHLLLRGPGLRTGDVSVLPSVEAQRPLTRVVRHLVSAPEPEDAARLARIGVGFVYAPAPADPTLTGNLDSLSGVTQGSAIRPGSRAWQVDAGVPRTAVGSATALTGTDPWRPWLLGAQGLAVAAVLVLAAPTRRRTR